MKKLLINKHNLILLFAVLLLILLNAIFIQDALISGYKASVILSSIGFSIFFISVISINRIFFTIFFIIVLFFGNILAYFKVFFGIDFNESVLESTLNTNYEEASTFIHYEIIGWMIAFWLIPALIFIRKSNLLKINFKSKIKITFLSSLLGAMIFYTPLLFLRSTNPIVFLQHMAAIHLYPASFVNTFKTYYKHNKFRSNAEKINVFADYKFKFLNKGVKVVLVLGESARGDRFTINGYERETTPNLSKIPNLVSFTDAYSLGTYTITGLKSIFRLRPFENENTFISIFNNLGFETSWISMQSFVNDVNTIASESQKLITKEMVVQNSNYDVKDENLISYLQQTLNDNKSKNQLIILHTQGSHRTYDDRYSENFKKYTPTCSAINERNVWKRIFHRQSCYSLIEANNSYDNSILYTDYVLSKFINELKPYKAMFIYISDHGESLGENGTYLHSHKYETAPKEQIHIPYILWFSEKLLQQNPNVKQNLKIASNNMHKKVDQSTVIHSILDCIGVKSEMINKRKSVCAVTLGDNECVF